jgi:Flp pilus assembly protein TadG
MTSVTTKRARQRGQSLVEIALVTPLLLIALYIPFDFGVAFFMGHLTQNAAREGARIGSGLQKTGTAPNYVFDSSQAATVKTEVLNRMPNFLTNKNVTVKFYDGASCMQFIEVTAQGQYNYFLYQVMRLFGGTVPNSVPLSRTTQLRYVYQPYTNTDYCTVSTTYGPYYS